MRDLGLHAEHDSSQVDSKHLLPCLLILVSKISRPFDESGRRGIILDAHDGFCALPITASNTSYICGTIKLAKHGDGIFDPRFYLLGFADIDLCDGDLC